MGSWKDFIEIVVSKLRPEKPDNLTLFIFLQMPGLFSHLIKPVSRHGSAFNFNDTSSGALLSYFTF